ncbi:MAG: hypothetical protein EHM65_00935 [Acidobacteriales bacterium]|nr:MAG: hypothetical protein EHM65_00935 [Terriglobales bacterium]
MNYIRTLFRCYSLAFHALFVFIAAGMAVVMLASGPHTINFFLLPWTSDASLVYGLIALALIGVTILLLAARGKMRLLFLLWSLLVLGLIVRYFFFSQYTFTPQSGELRFALLAILASAVAVIGAGLRPSARTR